ncbi:PREDICTED: dopamine receptor 4-like [Priapulus caudatus]|uniref:Dopamine receptor 4-like n=1 Tax=Priapulus caudatus TaxID=37621 RepID=A0ABM1EFP9_PRICU|nr:PREDICTED: dopamine receptor 4-like [Priapulus caudatus]
MSNNTTGALASDDDQQMALVGTIIVALTMAAINVAVVLGNAVVVVSICRHKALHVAHNYVLLSLAVADLLLGVAVLPVHVVYATTAVWTFAAWYCRVSFALDVALSNCSILHLCVIAGERLLALRWPLHYRKVARVLVAWGVCLAWLLSAGMGIVVAAVPRSWHGDGVVEAGGACVLAVTFRFAVVCGLLSFYAPLAFMAAAYVWMALTVKRQLRRTAAADGPATPAARVAARRLRSEVALTRAMAAVLGVFFVFWLPFATLNPWVALHADAPTSVMTFATWCGYANSMVNPIVYSIFSVKMRAAFFATIRCRGGVS